LARGALTENIAVTKITAREITIVKGGRTILRELSMEAEGGEFVAVIGANGAGKSTLLAALAGLTRPDRGAVLLNERALSAFGRAELAKLRAYLPQDPRCEWPIAVERLVALGLTPVLPAFGGLSAGDEARITEVLSECDLLDHRYQPATTLSGGELSRAMLARALVGHPDMLIVDEPLEGLDPRHALDTAARLRTVARGGKLVIAAIHDLTLAARYATRLIALDQGRVAMDGPPEEILTPGLLRTIFGVEASVTGAKGGAFVDYLGPL
jgi:iron complex transport system ATP-binding protein